MAEKAPDKGLEKSPDVPSAPIAVQQPHKLVELVDTINLLNEVSERISDDASSDWGSGGGSTGQSSARSSQPSARDLAIANLPEPAIMQKELQQHIETEIKSMRKKLSQASKHAKRSGNAYQLNELYAKIRRMNGLLKQIVGASIDVVKRIYIRIFIDKQSVL